MKTLGIILARAGSKGLAGKNTLPLAGQPMVAWTIDAAMAATKLDGIIVSTDSEPILALCSERGITALPRPAELADDTATVDAAARQALLAHEAATNQRFEAVVILYGNVPLRPTTLIDEAIAKLEATGCDSVQSVCPVGKMHPYWMKRLDGDRLLPYVENSVFRRQDLPAVFMLDGGIIAVTRASLMVEKPGQPHAFLGTDRRAIVTQPGAVVDVDTAEDYAVARVLIQREERQPTWLRDGFSIGSRRVGRDEPAFVIAELGVNHDGRLDRAIELCDAAKQAGADAVKVQLFDAKLLLSAEAELAAYQQDKATDPFALLNALQLDVDALRQVRDHARSLGLAFIATCFSLELLDTMRTLDVDAVKVASPDCVNLPLVKAVATLGKPMLIATGTTTREELATVLPQTRAACGSLPVVFMHCVSAYPVPDGAARLHRVAEHDELLPGTLAGYSDHTTEIHTGMLAVTLGARVIEKHLTYDTAAVGPDHAASYGPKQFANYVGHIRIAEAATRPFDSGDVDIEADVRRVSRQSLCATRDLPLGHVLSRDDLTVKRPGTGLPARMLSRVVGQTLKRAIKANHLLHEGDV